MAEASTTHGKCVMCGKQTSYSVYGNQIKCFVCHPYEQPDNTTHGMKCKHALTDLVCQYGNPFFINHLPYRQTPYSTTPAKK